MDKYEDTHSSNPRNIRTPSGFIILWDAIKTGYILPGHGKLRFTRDEAIRFAQNLEKRYGQA